MLEISREMGKARGIQLEPILEAASEMETDSPTQIEEAAPTASEEESKRVKAAAQQEINRCNGILKSLPEKTEDTQRDLSRTR